MPKRCRIHGSAIAIKLAVAHAAKIARATARTIPSPPAPKTYRIKGYCQRQPDRQAGENLATKHMTDGHSDRQYTNDQCLGLCPHCIREVDDSRKAGRQLPLCPSRSFHNYTKIQPSPLARGLTWRQRPCSITRNIGLLEVIAMERLTAKVITELVVANMVSGFEEFKFSTLAPSQFRIFLHPKDFDYFQPVFERLNNETKRALTEELSSRNSSWFKRTRYEVEGGDWNIHYYEDPDRIRESGFIEVESELAPPERDSFDGGRETIRVTTRGNASSKTTVRSRVHHPLDEPAGFATITYDDDGGRHVYAIHKEQTFIGRSKDDPKIDIRLQLNNDKDVSRQHACIRLDRANGAFYIKDFSTYGTTVNGQPVPRSIENEAPAGDHGIEFPLPRKARIGLAGRVFLDFQESNAP